MLPVCVVPHVGASAPRKPLNMLSKLRFSCTMTTMCRILPWFGGAGGAVGSGVGGGVGATLQFDGETVGAPVGVGDTCGMTREPPPLDEPPPQPLTAAATMS